MTGTALTAIVMKQTIDQMVAKQELPLPSTITPEAFKNAAVVALTDNPEIARCDTGSVFKSIRKLAGMGLIPDGHEAALVPFRTKQGEKYVLLCQAMPMVAGLIKRARNSGDIVSIWAEVVVGTEELTVWIEDGERRFRHDYNPLKRKADGKVEGAYCVAKLKDGTIEFLPMSRGEIDKIRAVSKSKDGPSWKNWYSEMAKKSVIRRLCKTLPMSADDRTRILESDSDTIGDLKDITPPQSLQEKIEAGKTIDPHDEVTGEVVEANPDNAFPGSPGWDGGMKAATEGKAFNENPHTDQQAMDDWAGGWLNVKDKPDG